LVFYERRPYDYCAAEFKPKYPGNINAGGGVDFKARSLRPKPHDGRGAKRDGH
jgi:hypothetical protein